MIWGLGIGLALAIGLYLVAPFLSRRAINTDSEEVLTYREELRALEQSEAPDTAKITALQRRLLKAAKADAPRQTLPSKTLPAVLMASLLGGGIGIYALIGSPNFQAETRQVAPSASESPSPNIETLLPKIEALLAEYPEDAKGWNLYGRTLMLNGDVEASLRAYERSLELMDSAEVRGEYEAAKRYAARENSGPSPEDIAAMQSLTTEDRAAAIKGMVESLRGKLDTDPSDVEGWSQLLRSRKVLGQIAQGEADIDTLRRVLPEQAETIIEQSGWED